VRRLFAAVVAALAPAAPAAANPWLVPSASGRAIEGYTVAQSVAPGGTLRLRVSTQPPSRYRVEVSRLGYRGRLMACVPGCAATHRGHARRHPRARARDVLRARWPVSDRVRIPRRWPSGYYVARLRLGRGGSRLVPFVVTGRPSAKVLVVLPVNTWQAYNPWGGKSAYAFNSSGGRAATAVSFDRPYAYVGLGFLPAFAFEYQIARYLERTGRHPAYTTDVEIDRRPGSLLGHRLVVVAGHDEYWSRRMRDAFESARDHRVNLAFLGADIGDWQVRYADGRRTLVAFHDTDRTDPLAHSPDWAASFDTLEPPRPSCALRGVGFERFAPLTEHHDLRVTARGAADPWLRGTGLRAGDRLRRLVSYEWDTVIDGCPTPPPTVLFHSAGGTQPADAVRYTAPSGATVFSAGTLPFAWALDDFGHRGYGDRRVRRFMDNALAAMLG
jgi:hypothetical protein